MSLLRAQSFSYGPLLLGISYFSPASVTNLLKQMKVEMMFLPHHHKTISRNFLFGMSTQGPQELTNELAPHMAEGQWVDCILVSCSL
jgi:hypothetical protein